MDYVVNHTSENGFVTPYSFNIYKASEYTEHLDKFLEFNKVGDNVEVEFNIRGKQYNGRVIILYLIGDVKKRKVHL